MKINDIVNEVDWKGLAKKGANLAIAGVDAAVGSNTQGFDTRTSDVKNAQRIIENLFNDWNKLIQQKNKSNQIHDQDQVLDYADLFIQNKLGLKINDYTSLREVASDIAHETFADVLNGSKTLIKNNQDLLNHFKKLIQIWAKIKSGSSQKNERVLNVNYAEIKVNGQDRFYFSFPGNETSFRRFKTTPTDPNRFYKTQELARPQFMRLIKDHKQKVRIKDLSPGNNRSFIEVTDYNI